MSRFQIQLQRRRGATMIIVVAFLALGLSLGIAFLFKASHHARFMQTVRESGQGGRASGVNSGTLGNNDEAPPQPSDLFNTALGQLIYDVNDDESGFYNALRGHSFARSMYGWKDTANALAYANNPNAPPAYSGFGRTQFQEPNYNVPDYNLINYTRFPETAFGNFIRFPERVPTASSQQIPGNYVAKNRPLTYPDENDVYLAAVRSDGYVLVPSFHRPWLAGSPPSVTFAGSPMWTTSPEGKYRIIRPRPVDHNGFPQMTANNVPIDPAARIDSWGDVENLEGKVIVTMVGGVPTIQQVRQLDSIWIDLDAPVRKWKGRLYKPLFAFLIVDLDGRINANTALNLKGNAGGTAHMSNQGWGPWEVNTTYLMGNATGSPSFPGVQLLGSGNMLIQRFGNDNRPTKVFALDNAAAQTASPLMNAPHYSRRDFDGSTITSLATPARMALPASSASAVPTQFYTSPVVGTGGTRTNWAGRYADANTVPLTLSGERDYHPSIYNPYLVPQRRSSTARPNDRAYSPEEMFYLNLKLNNDGAAYRSADMVSTAAQLGLASYPARSANPRWLLTSISNDYQFHGLRPWRTPAGAPPYAKIAPATLAAGGPIASPAAGSTQVGANSDFDVNWRSLVSALGAVDVNRKLTDYRQVLTDSFENNAANGTMNYARAVADRQRLAKDIFDRLAAATGARTSATEPLPAAPAPELNALRQLAQMAVNIVDYIDNDDYMTPFQWNLVDPSNPASGGLPGAGAIETLWGTELPRLVLNEVYCESWNRGRVPPGKAVGFWENNGRNHFEIYAEFLNTLTPANGTDAALSHGGAAPLRAFIGGNDIEVYRLKILRDNNFDAQLRAEDNTTGDLSPANQFQIINDLAPPTNAGAPYRLVSPSNATAAGPPAGGTNPGFYVVGPQANIPGADNPPVPVSHRTDQLDMPLFVNPDGAGNPQALDRPPTILLQRLACPHLPFDAVNNPYITVDYVIMPNGSVYDFREANGNAGAPPPVANRNTAFSYGRSQPHAANATRLATQPKTAPVPMNEINHSFFRQNTNADDPFDWLVHLDRQAISPIELLHVSAWKPHELTQQFIITNPPNVAPVPPASKHLHMADWGQLTNPANSNLARLYRALALLDVRNRTQGMAFGGRIPGKVNINTIWDPQVLMALADGNTATSQGNFFQASDIFDPVNPTDVTKLWARFKGQRSPFIGTGGTAVWTNAPTTLGDRPFLPAPNFVPSGDVQLGIPLPEEDVRRSLVGSDLFANTSQTHPYLKNEMLNKIFNNVTTRSNTFAIWCTIGYFEVTNPGPYNLQNRPRLGPEIDLDTGANIRHKFFSIVDRTNLTIDPTSNAARMRQGPRPVFLSYEPVTATDILAPDPDTSARPNMLPISVPVRVPATSGTANGITGTYDGIAWTIRPNDRILLDIGGVQENVRVASVAFIANIGGNVTLELPSSATGIGPQHYRGCVMQLPIPVATGPSTTFARLGNPGPQPGFDYRDQRYSGVVRFVTEVKR